MNNLYKIGVRGHDIGELSTEEIIDFCHKNTIDGLQLVINKTWPKLYENRNKEAIIGNINLLLDSNIQIFLLGCYFNPIHPNKEFLESEISRVLFVNEIAQEMNLPFIGSETGSVDGDQWSYNPLNHTNESFNACASTLNIIKDQIKDVKFLVEPVFDHVIYDITMQEKILNILGDKFLTTLDLCNLLNTKNYNDYELIFKKAIESQKNNICLLHFKNFKIIEGVKVGCELDKGIIDYPKIIKILKEHKLLHIPIIVEELSGKELTSSIMYIRGIR